MSYDGTSLRAYKNGDLVSGPNPGPFTTSTQSNLNIGYDYSNGIYFHGQIDEVRISDIARSDGWIKASYNNQNNPSAFLTFSGQSIIIIPTMTEWGMIIFMVLAGLWSIYYLRRKRRAES